MSKEFTSISDEFKDQSIKGPMSKFEHDLYDEDKDVAHKLIRVKRFGSVKNESWKIFENNKSVFVIDGAKLTKKEKEFLYTVDGIRFLIDQYKIGITSLNNLKKEFKEKIKG